MGLKALFSTPSNKVARPYRTDTFGLATSDTYLTAHKNEK